MDRRDEVCVLLPAYNEAETIESVVRGFRKAGFGNIVVADGGSSDDTAELAEAAGARVFEQTGSGKGQAVREAVRQHVDREYVLMADADETYRAAEAGRMLKPLFEGQADHVIGNRFADMKPGAMTRLNQVGNRVINAVFSFIHGHDHKDILSGYRAFTRNTFERFRLDADGFGIETELAVECVRQGLDVEVVPIRYESRSGSSETNLSPFRDGGRIILTLYTLAKTNNPIFYFGSVASTSAVAGVGTGLFVGYRYFSAGVSHQILALLAVFLVLLAVQLLMFGVLSDILVSISREQTRRLEEISDQLRELEESER